MVPAWTGSGSVLSAACVCYFVSLEHTLSAVYRGGSTYRGKKKDVLSIFYHELRSKISQDTKGLSYLLEWFFPVKYHQKNEPLNTQSTVWSVNTSLQSRSGLHLWAPTGESSWEKVTSQMYSLLLQRTQTATRPPRVTPTVEAATPTTTSIIWAPVWGHHKKTLAVKLLFKMF